MVFARSLFRSFQLGDFVLDAGGDLTILSLQLTQLQEFARGFGRVVGYVAANSLDVPLDILKLLREKDSQGFRGVCAHIVKVLFIQCSVSFRNIRL